MTRVRRIRGQVEAIERGLEAEIGCADILQLVASVRGAVNGLTVELIEDQHPQSCGRGEEQQGASRGSRRAHRRGALTSEVIGAPGLWPSLAPLHREAAAPSHIRIVTTTAMASTDRTSTSMDMTTPSRGITAIVDGSSILVGNRAWMTENGIIVSGDADQKPTLGSEVLVARNEHLKGSMTVADAIRPEARRCD